MKFLDMFAGIGGFHRGLSDAGHECVGAIEIDDAARAVYRRHFPGTPLWRDATRVEPSDLPQFDCLCGGFPCQPFSVSGRRGGLDDARGTLFFDIARIAEGARPRYLLLENVPGFLNHDEGDTFETFLRVMDACGYDTEWQVLHGEDWLPQARHRLWIVCRSRDGGARPVLPVAREGGQDTRLRPREAGEGPVTAPTLRTIANVTQSATIHSDDLAQTLCATAHGRSERTGLYAVPRLKRVSPNRQGYRIYDSTNALAQCQQASAGNFGGKTGMYAVPFAGAHGGCHGQHIRKGNLYTLSTWKEDVCVATPAVDLGEMDSSIQGNYVEEMGERIRRGEYRVRRLTPVECERVQGFPETTYRVTIDYSPEWFTGTSVGAERQNGADRQCAGRATDGGDAGRSPENASCAGSSSPTSGQASSPGGVSTAPLRVHARLRGGQIHVSSLERSPSSASGAAGARWSPHPAPIGDFAQVAAFISGTLASGLIGGVVASPMSATGSSARGSGDCADGASGGVMAQPASAAIPASTTPCPHSTSTTSSHTHTLPAAPTWATLCCSALHAIMRFIPDGKIRAASSLLLSLEAEVGWTEFGIDENGKVIEISETSRYKLCGNAVMPPVVEFLGAMME